MAQTQAPYTPLTSRKAELIASRPFNRPPRVRPGWAETTVELPTPPQPPPRPPQGAWLLLAMPLLTVVVMVAALSFAGLGSNALAFAIPMGAMALVGVIGTILNSRSQERRQREEHAERVAFYEEQLAEAQERLAERAESERAARLYVAPAPAGLLQIARLNEAERPPDPRLWERRPYDDDFLELRLGVGTALPAFRVQAPTPPRDAPTDRRLSAIQRQYAHLSGVPVTLPLSRYTI